jgi:hypothetical protein
MRSFSAFVGLIIIMVVGAGLSAQSPTLPAAPQSPSQGPGSSFPGQQQPGAPGATGPTNNNPSGTRTPGSAVPTGSGQDNLFIELKDVYDYTQVNPNTKGPDGLPLYSFLIPGNDSQTDLTLYQDHSWGTNRIQYLGIFRETNDVRWDPEHSSLQRGYFRIYNKNTEINLGDYLVNYSRFTYNQNIKGVSVVHKFNEKWKFSANMGVFTDRWGSIFKDDILGQPFTRVVGGFRGEYKFMPNKTIGVNFAEGHDLVGSIRPDLVNGLIGVNNQILSVDSKMDFGRKFSLDGEAAYSLTNPNIEQEHVEVADWAVRLDTRYREGWFTMRENYTRMEPNFFAVNARQLADLQDMGINLSEDAGSHLTIEESYRYTENDVRHEQPLGATIFKVPEVRFSFRRLPKLGRTLFDFGYRERRETGPFDATTSNGTKIIERIPYADVSVPIGTTLFSVGYEHRAYDSVNDVTQSTGVNRVSASLRSILDWGGWTFSPNFRYEIEREVFFTAFGTNDNRNIAAIMYIDAPKYFQMELIYREVGASLFTQCATTSTSQCGSFTNLPANVNILLPSGFGRPQYHVALTYKYKNSDSRELILAFDRNSNYFAVQGQAFDERVFSATILWRYKKQGEKSK